MIGKVGRGWRVGGLIRYLLGPGRFNEHVRPRVVAIWDGRPERWQPERVDGRLDCADLIAEMAAPQIAAGLPQSEPVPGPNGKTPLGPVWHCSMRNHADDRVLSDAEWAEIAAEVLDRTGIAPRGDPFGCRWVVVRHADDHVHIAAVLVRQDTARRVHPKFDHTRIREVCREMEERFGLWVTSAADRTAVRHPGRAEQEKARRIAEHGAYVGWVTHGRPSRTVLSAAVRRASVRARSPEEFLGELEYGGLMTRAHRDSSGGIDGYAVAVPGDVDAGRNTVWYSGSQLGRDLSMPKLREVWASAAAPPEAITAEPTERSRTGRAERAETVEEATEAVRAATEAMRGPVAEDSRDSSGREGRATPDAGTRRETLDGAEATDGDGVAHSLRDLLEALDLVATRRRFPELDGIGARYDGVARTSRTVLPSSWTAEARALRTAAWRLARLGPTPAIGPERAPLAALVAAVAALVVEIAAHRVAQHRLAQARLARRSAEQLAVAAAARRPPLAPTPSARGRVPDEVPTTATGRGAGPRAPGRTDPVHGSPFMPRPGASPGPRPPGPRGRGR